MSLSGIADTAPDTTIPGTTLPMALQALTQGNSPLTLGPMLAPVQESAGPVMPQQTPQQSQQASNTPQSEQGQQLIQPKKQGYSALDIILGLLGGAQAGATIRQRYQQQMMGPVLADASMKLNAALEAGDFKTAQSLLSQLGQYADQTPAAFQAAQAFTEKYNAKYNKFQANTAMAELYGPKTAAGSFAEALAAKLKDPRVAGALDPAETQRLFSAAHTNRMIREPYAEIIDPVNGQLLARYTQPQGQTLKDISPTESTVLEARNIDKSTYLDLRNLHAQDPTDSLMNPQQKLAWQQIVQGSPTELGMNAALTQRNVALSVPASEQGKTAMTNRQTLRGAGLAVTAPPTQTQQPQQVPQAQSTQSSQGFYRAEATTPDGQSATLEFDSPQKLQQVVQQNKLKLTSPITWSQERTGIAGEASGSQPQPAQPNTMQPRPATTPQQQTSTAPFNEAELGPQLAEQQTAIEGKRTNVVQTNRNVADFQSKPEQAQAAWRVDAQGKFHTFANPTAAQVAGQADVIEPDGTRYRGKWMQTSEAEQGNKDIKAIVAAQGNIRSLVSTLEDAKIPMSDKQGISTMLGQAAAEGFRIPFIDIYARVGGGRTLPNTGMYAQAATLVQTLEPLFNPKNADNRQMETFKNTISGAMKTVPGAIATLKSLDKVLQTKGESILSTAGAMEAKPTPLDKSKGTFGILEKRGK